MDSSKRQDNPRLDEVEPRESAGRDTIARYQAQFRAAAYECLSILSGETIDRVYCDYHDDFVARSLKTGKPVYHFYQVKTKNKRNHQWGKLDIFGLYKKKQPCSEKIADSFVGKLLLHTIRFTNSCGNVIFLTNVQFDNDIEGMIECFEKEDFTNKNIKQLIENFNDALVDGDPLDEKDVQKRLGKLILKPGVSYLNPHDHDFYALARDAIYEYSEIDLQHVECEEIIHNLIGLVETKSFSKLISELGENELDDSVGIGISELLDILSISKGAYEELAKGGDPNAIKNASIIQRKLSEAGASQSMIEYCSGSKVQWDIWIRDKRHTLPEFELNFLLDDLAAINNMLAKGKIGFAEMEKKIDGLWKKIVDKGIATSLTKDLLLGGVFSALVRNES